MCVWGIGLPFDHPIWQNLPPCRCANGNVPTTTTEPWLPTFRQKLPEPLPLVPEPVEDAMARWLRDRGWKVKPPKTHPDTPTPAGATNTDGGHPDDPHRGRRTAEYAAAAPPGGSRPALP